MHKLTAAVVAALLWAVPANAALIEYSATATFFSDCIYGCENQPVPLLGTLTVNTATGLFSQVNVPKFAGQNWPNIIAQGNRDGGGYFLDIETTSLNAGCIGDDNLRPGCFDVLHLLLSKSPPELLQSAAGLILAGSYVYFPDCPCAYESKVDGSLTMVTPIPGALPLFASALVLLGWLVRRRARVKL